MFVAVRKKTKEEKNMTTLLQSYKLKTKATKTKATTTIVIATKATQHQSILIMRRKNNVSIRYKHS